MVTKSTLLYWQDHFEFDVQRAMEIVWARMMLVKAHPHEHFIEELRRAKEELQAARVRRDTIRLLLA